MKVFISTLVMLAVGTAIAAPSTTITVPNTGSSTTSAAAVAPKKSNISALVELTNEKSHAAIDANSKDLETALETKLTYKLSNTQSLRGSAYIQTLTREKEDDVHTNLYYVYLQYADSELFKIGDRAFRGAVRQYYLGFGDGHNDGTEAITRLYLSTPFKINERVTITPFLNPRIYWGSQSREDAGKAKVDYLGILETEVAVSDKVSYTLDLIHRERVTKDKSFGYFELDNWVTVSLADRTSITEAITMDLGFYHIGNSTAKTGSGTGNGFTLDKNGTIYYVRANVNF